VQIEASFEGYAAAWLRHHPYSPRMRITQAEYERRALEKGRVAVWSICRDLIKGQITAIETGILTFRRLSWIDTSAFRRNNYAAHRTTEVVAVTSADRQCSRLTSR
jgi:hypothetical protein